MSDFQFINANDLAQRLDEPGLQIVDIRDARSFDGGRIRGATLLDNGNLGAFLESADPDAPLVVCCYHGNSSQSAAAFLASKGFSKVYSLDGGFEMWRTLYPEHIDGLARP